MYIATDNEQQALTSSVASNSALNIRTMDRAVQEDARLVSFNGTEQGTVGLISSFPRDLRAYSNSDSALSLSIKVEQSVSKPLWLGLACQGDCRQQVDIAKLVNTRLAEWQNVSISLACFAGEPMDFGKIAMPFYLSTDAEVYIS